MLFVFLGTSTKEYNECFFTYIKKKKTVFLACRSQERVYVAAHVFVGVCTVYMSVRCVCVCVTFKVPEAKLSVDFLTSYRVLFNHQK